MLKINGMLALDVSCPRLARMLPGLSQGTNNHALASLFPPCKFPQTKHRPCFAARHPQTPSHTHHIATTWNSATMIFTPYLIALVAACPSVLAAPADVTIANVTLANATLAPLQQVQNGTNQPLNVQDQLLGNNTRGLSKCFVSWPYTDTFRWLQPTCTTLGTWMANTFRSLIRSNVSKKSAFRISRSVSSVVMLTRSTTIAFNVAVAASIATFSSIG